MTAPNPNYDALLTTTLAKFDRKLVDNVFSARFLLDWLKRAGNIKKVDGGNKIVVPLMHAMNTTFSTYSGYDALFTGTGAQEGISAAEYPWRQAAVTIAINGIEEAMNEGESAILDLLDSKVTQATETASEKFDQMFFLDGSGNSGKDWYGLANLVANTGAVGNIDPSVAGSEFWKSVVIDANGDSAPARSDADWRKAVNSASKGNDKPNFGITTQDLFESYEGSMVPALRYSDNKTADAGFENLLFKSIVLGFDAYCQTGVTYFLNSKYIGLRVHKGTWFRNTGFKTVPDKDGRWANILSYGNLVTSARMRQAKVINQVP